MSGSSPISPASRLFNAQKRWVDFYTDAFGRLRISEAVTLFDSKQINNGGGDYWNTTLTGGGTATYDANTVSTALAVTGGTDRSMRQTNRYFNYQAGKSTLVFMTFSGAQSVANVTKRVGYFDDNDGIFFSTTGAGAFLTQRTSTSGAPSDVATVAQAAWNVDPMNGLGPSGVNLNFSLDQIFWIDFEWLGVGIVRCGWVVGGVLYTSHVFQNTNNVLTVVYMKSPNLPLRYEVVSSGGAGSLNQICCSVMSEAGQENIGTYRSADRAITQQTITNTLEPLISIRLKSTYRYATVIPTDFTVMTNSNAYFRYVLTLGGTVTGGSAASWVSAGANSPVEYDVTRNGLMNEDGIKITSGYSSTQSRIAASRLAGTQNLGITYAGTQQELILGAQNTAGANADCYASIGWLELT